MDGLIQVVYHPVNQQRRVRYVYIIDDNIPEGRHFDVYRYNITYSTPITPAVTNTVCQSIIGLFQTLGLTVTPGTNYTIKGL